MTDLTISISPRPAALLLLALLPAAACTGTDEGGEATAGVSLASPDVTAALEAIEAPRIEEHIRVLAHDSMEGRAPGTAGFAASADYAEETLRSLGLEPGGDGGTYRQAVPLRNATVVEERSSLTVHGASGTSEMRYDDDFYLGADPLREEVSIDSAPVVFVGFGVSAPGLGYDDYGDIDVEGKVVLYLNGAPTSFPSNERAYYSSGATKVGEALRRGAIGTMTFWAPDDPRLRWEVNANRSKRGAYAWLDGAGTPNRGDEQLLGSASLNHSAAEALFEGAAPSMADALSAAAANTPQAFDLVSTVSIHTRTEHRDVDSWNVVATLPGSDPALSDEHVAYIGHVDHFGVGVEVDGDAIYNGAHDNASGTSIVLEIARAFASLPERPRRSVVFLIVTAEEWGLLGSDFFAEHPTLGGGEVVTAFSLDMPFLFHPLMDIVPYGAEHSSLGGSVRTAADHLGIGIGPDPIPEQVLFIRSDHFSFIRRGIPSLFIKSGFETGDDRDGGAINTAFRQNLYHTPFDESDQGFDFESGAQHARVNFLTGYLVAQEDNRPTWNVGDFFGELFGGM